jgi:RNA polymerase sigma-70 factor (ECF subfamily)
VRDPDIDLVRQVGQGDSRAAAALVARHAGKIGALARRMLNDAAEAEDVAQEVFLRVWRAAPGWREENAKFETWMHRVALNLCYDRLRRRRERASPEAGADLADGAAGPSQSLLESQRAALVAAAVAQLPARQRAAITLCHYNELSNIEAAAALEISVDALESLLARGRRALKAALSDVVEDLLGEAESPALGARSLGARSLGAAP